MPENNKKESAYVYQPYPKMIYQSGKPGIGPGIVVKDKTEEDKVKAEWRKELAGGKISKTTDSKKHKKK